MKNKPLQITLLFLFGFFLVLYFGQASGYYEYKTSQKTTLTKESIEQFEKDIKEGKEIHFENYKKEEKNNSNKLSKGILSASRFLEKEINRVIVFTFHSLSKVIE